MSVALDPLKQSWAVDNLGPKTVKLASVTWKESHITPLKLVIAFAEMV